MARSQERLKERQERLSPTLQQERKCFDQTKKKRQYDSNMTCLMRWKETCCFFPQKKKGKEERSHFPHEGEVIMQILMKSMNPNSP